MLYTSNFVLDSIISYHIILDKKGVWGSSLLEQSGRMIDQVQCGKFRTIINFEACIKEL